MTKNLLTVSEAAKLLNVSRQDIYAATARGRLPATHLGTFVLVSRSALEKYAHSRQHTIKPHK